MGEEKHQTIIFVTTHLIFSMLMVMGSLPRFIEGHNWVDRGGRHQWAAAPWCSMWGIADQELCTGIMAAGCGRGRKLASLLPDVQVGGGRKCSVKLRGRRHPTKSSYLTLQNLHPWTESRLWRRGFTACCIGAFLPHRCSPSPLARPCAEGKYSP